jgi:hypothetical protein
VKGELIQNAKSKSPERARYVLGGVWRVKEGALTGAGLITSGFSVEIKVPEKAPIMSSYRSDDCKRIADGLRPGDRYEEDLRTPQFALRPGLLYPDTSYPFRAFVF